MVNEYRIRETGEHVEHWQLGAIFPQNFIGFEPTDEYLDSLGVDIVYPAAEPQLSEGQTAAREGIELVDNQWRFKWAVTQMSSAEISQALDKRKADWINAVDAKIASIYNRWLRFEAEYVAREAAARAFKAANYEGDPGVWVTAFSSNAGLSNQTAADLIIAQADGLRTALQALGALRMAKYGISAASTVAGAQAAHDSIIAQADAIAAAL